MACEPLRLFGATSLGPVVNARESMLLFVHSGQARITLDPAFAVPLSAGQACWIPPGINYRVRGSGGSVVLPVAVPQVRPDALSACSVMTVPIDWQDWVLHQFSRSLGYLRTDSSAGSHLASVVAAATPAAQGVTRQLSGPPLPRSAEALHVAHAVIRWPADPRAADHFATEVSVAVRTLQRQFRDETGLAFGAWRTATRIAAAARLLREHPVAEVATKVGYDSPAGFTRAFRRHTGHAPHEFRSSDSAVVPTELWATFPAGLPPAVPPGETWRRINDFDVVVWMYRGSAQATVGQSSHQLRVGDALCLPAGVPNVVRVDPGSLLLPLGSAPARRGRTTEVSRPVHFSTTDEPWLLATIVANYTMLRPTIHDDTEIVRLVRAMAQADSSSRSRDVDLVVAAACRHPTDRRTTAEWASVLGADLITLRREFRAATGQSLGQWQAQRRMTLAREWLDAGDSIAVVARRLGYAHASGFSQAFRDAHGVTARRYRDAGSGATSEAVIVR